MEEKGLDISCNYISRQHYNCELIKAMLIDSECKEPYEFPSYQDVFEGYVKPHNLIESLNWVKTKDSLSDTQNEEQDRKIAHVRNGLLYLGSDLFEMFDDIVNKKKDVFPVHAWDLGETTSGETTSGEKDKQAYIKNYVLLDKHIQTDCFARFHLCRKIGATYKLNENHYSNGKEYVMSNKRMFYISRIDMENIMTMIRIVAVMGRNDSYLHGKLYKTILKLEKGIKKPIYLGEEGKADVKEWEEKSIPCKMSDGTVLGIIPEEIREPPTYENEYQRYVLPNIGTSALTLNATGSLYGTTIRSATNLYTFSANSMQ